MFRPQPKPPTAVVEISSSSSSSGSSDSGSDSDSDIQVVSNRPPPGPARPVMTGALPQQSRPAVTESSGSASSSSSSNQPKNLTQQSKLQFRPPATILGTSSQQNRSLNMSAFASTSNQGFASAKERAMINMRSEQLRLNLPPVAVAIAVPKLHATPFASTSASFNPFARVKSPEEDYSTPAESEKALRELVESTMDMENVDTSEAMPESMSGCTLLKHQVVGVHWLKDREKGKKKGGILADDMGLGKTIQMIALICANKPNTKPKTTLVVCPVSLMEQWKAEIKNKTDDSLRVYIHHGPGRTKDAVKLARYDVVITSYNTAVSEWVDPKPARETKPKVNPDGSIVKKKVPKEKELGCLFEVEYYRIILDEAHVIKGRTTKMHKACCDLVGEFRWCLTGTPIQNSIDDMFALFEFLGPIVKPMNEYYHFKEKIGIPIKNGRSKIAMSRLSVILKAVLLRRTKNTLIDGKPLIVLPKREIILVKGPFLDSDERQFYDAVEAKMQLTLNAFLKAGTLNNNYTNVLILLLRMRQACSHPSLVAGKSAVDDEEALEPVAQKDVPVEEEDDLDALTGALSGLAVASTSLESPCALCPSPAVSATNAYCRSCEQEMKQYGNLKFSTKIRKIMGILEEIRKEGKGKKTIVFSQFTSMFDLVEPFLVKAGLKFVRFDGKMNKVQKEAALEKIRHNSKYTVILISLKCGSVGLNLTACSRVILADIWWNPMIEEQAFDRSHRFGQTDDVKIYKLTIENTIEDRLLELQDKKREVSMAALDGGDLKATKLTTADIMFLFRGSGEGSCEEAQSRSVLSLLS